MLTRPMPKPIVPDQIQPFNKMINNLYKVMASHLEYFPDDIHKVQMLRDYMLEMEMSISEPDYDMLDAMERFQGSVYDETKGY